MQQYIMYETKENKKMRQKINKCKDNVHKSERNYFLRQPCYETLFSQTNKKLKKNRNQTPKSSSN